MPYRRYNRVIPWRFRGFARKRRVQQRMMRSRRRRNTLFRFRGRAAAYRRKRFMRRHGYQWRGRGGKKVVPLTYTYVGYINYDVNTNCVASGPIYVDDCYDPNPNLTGAWNVSSAGYDFWSKYYTWYRVCSAKISCRVTMVNAGSGAHMPVVAGFCVNPRPGESADPPSGGTWMQVAARGGSCVFLDSGSPRSKKCRSRYWSRNSVDDRSYRDLATLCGSSPDPANRTKMYLFLATSGQEVFQQAANITVRCVLKIKQYVEFSGAVGPEFEDRVQGRGLWSGGPEIEYEPPTDPGEAEKAAEMKEE